MRARLLFGQRAGVDRAQEVIEQALAGRRVVEGVTDAIGLRRLLDEGAQPRRRGVHAVEKEGMDGGVADRKLRRMEIPALIETAHQ